MIRQRPTIVQDTADGRCLDEVHGNIEFEEVAFIYPSRPDVMIFRDFSLFFPVGKTGAIIGGSGSGSGKSTIVALIERFYDPNQGEQMNCSPYVVVTLSVYLIYIISGHDYWCWASFAG